MNREIYKFKGLGELRNLALRLHEASEADIDIDGFGTSDKYKAVVDATAGEVACVTNKRYTVIQHKDVVMKAADTLSSLGLDCYGNVVNDGGRVFVNILFPTHKVDDGEKGIHIGVRLSNSFNLSAGLNFSMYGMRLACDNAMVLKNLLFSERKKHVGKIDIDSMLKTFINGAIEKNELFEELINESMKDSVTWKLTEGYIAQNVTGKKHQEILMNLIRDEAGNKKPNRWNIYNALTAYITHHNLKRHPSDKFERISANLITRNVESFIDPEKPMTIKKLVEVA